MCGSDVDMRAVLQRTVYEGVGWCLIRRAKSAEESAADSLLVGVGDEGGGKGGNEQSDEVVENGVVYVNEWRLESEVLVWIERRANHVSSSSATR